MKSMSRSLAAALALAFAASFVFAQALIPAEDFTRRPKLDRLTFSPDGKKFAALEEAKGRMNLVVGDFNGGAVKQITSYEASDVTNYRWISSNRLIFSLIDLKGGLATQHGGGLFAVDADGREGRQLSLTLKDCVETIRRCRSTDFFERVRGSNDEIIAVSNDRVLDSPDLIRLDTRTGKRTLLTERNPGGVTLWVVDRNLAPRAALSSDRKTLQSTFWYRDGASDTWRKVASYAFGEPHMEPLGFDGAGVLYVASNLESGDKLAIHKFDVAKGAPGERIAAHPGVDLGLVEDPRNPGSMLSPLLMDDERGEVVLYYPLTQILQAA